MSKRSKSLRVRGLAVAAALLLFVGCNVNLGEEEGGEEDLAAKVLSSNPSGYSSTNDSTLSLSVVGSLPGAYLTSADIEVVGNDGSTIGTLNLTEATVVIREVELYMEDDEEEEDEGTEAVEAHDDDDDAHDDDDDDEDEEGEDDDDLDFEGPFIVDLLNNTMLPTPESISVPAGIYSEVEFEILKLDGDEAAELGIEANDPLYGNSIYVAGTYTPVGGSPVDFSMSYDVSESFLIQTNGGCEISSDITNEFVVAFRMAHWFRFDDPETNVSFSDLGAGAIALDETQAGVSAQVRDAIKNNIGASADFGRDEDGDGELSEDEDSEDEDEEDDV